MSVFVRTNTLFRLARYQGGPYSIVCCCGGWLKPGREEHAPVAQRIERLTTDQKVGGSNPFRRTNEAFPVKEGLFCCLSKPADVAV